MRRLALCLVVYLLSGCAALKRNYTVTFKDGSDRADVIAWVCVRPDGDPPQELECIDLRAFAEMVRMRSQGTGPETRL